MIDRQKMIVVMLVSILWVYLFSSHTMAGSKNEEGIPSNISYQVVDSAEISKISYFIDKYEGVPRLHFEVTIKNNAKEPKRFRLNIFLPEGPSAGGFYPLKGAVEPGGSRTEKYPMYFNQMPTGFTMVVKEL